MILRGNIESNYRDVLLIYLYKVYVTVVSAIYLSVICIRYSQYYPSFLYTIKPN